MIILFLGPWWPSSFWWLGNLLQIAPVWFLSFPGLFLLLVALLLRDKLSVLLLLFSGTVLLFGVLDFQVPDFMGKDKIQNGSFSIKILDMNLGNKIDESALGEYILALQPDLIVLQEVNSAELNTVLGLLPDRVWYQNLNSHLGIISRFKIKRAQVFDRHLLGGGGGYVGRYEMEGPSGTFYVVNVHLNTPRDGLDALLADHLAGIPTMKRITESQATESHLAAKEAMSLNPILIAGDFNMTQKNPIYHRYWSSFQNSFSKKGLGFGYTKHTRWHGARIDHILCDSHWQVIFAESGPAIGGDHRPVFAEFRYLSRR